MQKRGAALRAVQDTVLRQAQDEREPGAAGGPRLGSGQAPSLAFTPVPRRYRHDGWTPERQVAFIEALADTGRANRSSLFNLA
ncbi:MAG TPA: hypothetical protein VHM92_04155 [Allosphingosinicella sp.]|nr:hypothetical protein [Allosphingosinicella sp.]